MLIFYNCTTLSIFFYTRIGYLDLFHRQELLELLGMPVLRARGEAEALCAQLNSEGHVDACITADSDAFLFGAKCVIKCLRSNCKVSNGGLQFSKLQYFSINAPT